MKAFLYLSLSKKLTDGDVFPYFLRPLIVRGFGQSIVERTEKVRPSYFGNLLFCNYTPAEALSFVVEHAILPLRNGALGLVENNG